MEATQNRTKLTNAEICELVSLYNEFILSSFAGHFCNVDDIYTSTKHFPLFLQNNNYEIWKIN
jgi:hypothetical protein